MTRATCLTLSAFRMATGILLNEQAPRLHPPQKTDVSRDPAGWHRIGQSGTEGHADDEGVPISKHEAISFQDVHRRVLHPIPGSEAVS